MALKTLGTTSTTILRALPAWSAVLAAADVAAIGQTISGDHNFATNLAAGEFGASAVLATGSTHSNTTLDTLAAVSGAPLAQIQVGDKVIGAGIPPGTYVSAKPTATSVTLSQAATTTAALVPVVFVRAVRPMLEANGLLHVPSRGILKVLPGDVVALDNLGWPILVSGASIGYSGSQWNLV